MTAPPGSATGIVLTDAGYEAGTGGNGGPSGITTDIGPDVNDVVTGCNAEVIDKATAGSPKHIATDGGATVGAGGV